VPGESTVAIVSAAPLGVPVSVTNQDGPLSFNDTTKLQLQVWDFEALQDIQVCGFDLLFSGGLRFAHINEQYNAFALFSGGAAPLASVVSSNSFDGIGPVVDLEARRPIGDCGLAVYGSVRGALLFGSEHQVASAVNATFLGATSTDSINSADRHDRVLPVGELEFGLEYGRKVGNSRVFGQIALVGQDWVGAGNASRSNTTTVLGVPFGGTTSDSDIGFFGLAFRFGVNY
jgi:hypothetical protein